MTNEPGRRRRFWLKILIGFCLSALLLVVSVLIFFVYSVHHALYGFSNVMIWNRSGHDVRFEMVTVDDQVIWTGPALIVSPKDLKKPYLDNRRHAMMLGFSAPGKLLELKVVIRSKTEDKETLSCTLDNRSRPCFFEVFYHQGRLSCGDCGKDFFD